MGSASLRLLETHFSFGRNIAAEASRFNIVSNLTGPRLNLRLYALETNALQLDQLVGQKKNFFFNKRLLFSARITKILWYAFSGSCYVK